MGILSRKITDKDLEERLQFFTTTPDPFGEPLLSKLPTAWGLRQAETEMAIWNVFPYVDDGNRYRAPFGHYLIRTPLVMLLINPFAHLRVGSGLYSTPEEIADHLCFTCHRDPFYDLKLLLSEKPPAGKSDYFEGLNILEQKITALLDGKTLADRLKWRIAQQIIPHVNLYWQSFLGDSGWIARMKRLDCDKEKNLAPAMRLEFNVFERFLYYSATAYPQQPSSVLQKYFPRLYLTSVAWQGLKRWAHERCNALPDEHGLTAYISRVVRSLTPTYKVGL